MIYHSREMSNHRHNKKTVVVRRSFIISALALVAAGLFLTPSTTNIRFKGYPSTTRSTTTTSTTSSSTTTNSRSTGTETKLEDFAKSAFDTELYYHLEQPYLAYPCLPRKIHVAQASNVDPASSLVNMTLSFMLDFDLCADVEPSVTYGRGLFSEATTVRASAPVQFNFDSSVTHEHYKSDWIYHVTIPNMLAGKVRYWYRIKVHTKSPSVDASAKTVAASLAPPQPSCSLRSFALRGNQIVMGETTTLAFVTPPMPGSPTTLALVGDLGQTENSTKTMNHILEATQSWWSPFLNVVPVTAVLIAGDLSYADGEPRRWDRWLDLMEPLLRTTPMQAAAGNHEIECDNKTLDVFVPYENLFRNPNRVGPPDMQPVDDDYRKTLWRQSCQGPSAFLGHYNYGNAFYSFIHGLVHIVVLNSYTDSTVGSPQYVWLEQTLETKVDRTATPWLLVMFHCPLHTTFMGHVNGTNQVEMLSNMEPLFVQYQVNIIISGHDHAFMRTYPMVGNEKDPSGKGPIYLTLGAGGNREQHTAGFINDNPEPWIAKRDNDEYGYGNLFVANATHARFKWVRDGTTTKGVQDDTWLLNQMYKDKKHA